MWRVGRVCHLSLGRASTCRNRAIQRPPAGNLATLERITEDRVTDASEGENESTWTKLRRRKVVQWGIVYAAGAWGLLQGLEYVTSTFDWPRQIQQFTTLALLIGLPIVLLIAWYHGDQGRQRVSAAELIIPPRHRSSHRALPRARLTTSRTTRSRCCRSSTCPATRTTSTSRTGSRRRS